MKGRAGLHTLLTLNPAGNDKNLNLCLYWAERKSARAAPVSTALHLAWLAGPQTGEAGEAAGERDEPRPDEYQDVEHLRTRPARPGLSHPRYRPSYILQVTKLTSQDLVLPDIYFWPIITSRRLHYTSLKVVLHNSFHFSCVDKIQGRSYADIDAFCQVYHTCSAGENLNNIQFSRLCPNGKKLSCRVEFSNQEKQQQEQSSTREARPVGGGTWWTANSRRSFTTLWRRSSRRTLMVNIILTSLTFTE